jgi:energy-converting hydrogenase Eha subunit B
MIAGVLGGLFITGLALLLLALFVAIPIKIGACLADARRTGFLWCGLSAIIGVLAGEIAARLLGGYVGGPIAAFLGFVIAIRLLLGTSLAGAIGLTFIAIMVALLGLWLLSFAGLVLIPDSPPAVSI